MKAEATLVFEQGTLAALAEESAKLGDPIGELASQAFELLLDEQPGDQHGSNHGLSSLRRLPTQVMQVEHLFDAFEEHFNVPTTGIQLDDQRGGPLSQRQGGHQQDEASQEARLLAELAAFGAGFLLLLTTQGGGLLG